MIGEKLEFRHCTDDDGLLIVFDSLKLQSRSLNSLMGLSCQQEGYTTFTWTLSPTPICFARWTIEAQFFLQWQYNNKIHLEYIEIQRVRWSIHFLNGIRFHIVKEWICEWPILRLYLLLTVKTIKNRLPESSTSTILSRMRCQLFIRQPNSYYIYCNNREREEEEAQRVMMVKQQLEEVGTLSNVQA